MHTSNKSMTRANHKAPSKNPTDTKPSTQKTGGEEENQDWALRETVETEV